MANQNPSHNEFRSAHSNGDKRRYKEALLADEGFIIATSEVSSLSHFPIQTGDEFGILQTVTLRPNQSYTWYYFGDPGARVTLSLQRVLNSGGHTHSGRTSARASVGTISPNSLVLHGKWPQNIPAVYTANDVCGSIRLKALFSPGNPRTAVSQMNIMIQGLVPIQETKNLRLKGPRPEHPSPYWARTSFVRKLVQISNKYAKKRQKHITITDASLEWGG